MISSFATLGSSSALSAFIPVRRGDAIDEYFRAKVNPKQKDTENKQIPSDEYAGGYAEATKGSARPEILRTPEEEVQ
jgi:hypothetical protein